MESQDSDKNINKDDNNGENITWNDLVSIFRYTINNSFITLHTIRMSFNAEIYER